MHRLRLLGGASIETQGGALTGPVAQRRRLALLALLAASPTGAASRERVAALLFPEVDAESARHGVSNALHAIRRALGRDAVIAVGDELRLNPEVVASDVAAFEGALAAGERERAAALYQGPFLDGFHVPDAPELEQWVESERQRLARAHARALEGLAEAHEARGDFSGAAEWWRRLAACDPYSSRVAVRTMCALEAAGDAAAAVHHARLHEALVRAGLDVAPDAEVSAVAERIRARTVGMTLTPTALPAPSPSGASTSAAEAESPEHPTPSVRPTSSRGRRPAALLATAAAALVVLGAGGSFGWRWHGDRAAAFEGAPIRRIAVLPLENLSGDSTQDYLSDGLTEALITELARLRSDLHIISRTSVMQYKRKARPLPAVARELGVDAVVEGSVVREGGRVRVTVQLVRAPSDRHLWAERYEREYREILALQADIAGAVAREVGHRTPPRASSPPRRVAAPIDPAVHEAHLRGRHALSRSSWLGAKLAIQYFQRAIAGDSGYAPAWAGLADAYVLLAFFPDSVEPRVAYPLATAAARRAVALDDGLAEAHTALANALQHQTDFVGAEAAIRRALALDPNDAGAHQKLGELLAGAGRPADAERELEAARSLDPLSPVVQCAYGATLEAQGQYDRAIAVYRRVLEQDSTHVLAHSVLARALIFAGRYDDALTALDRFHRITGVRRWQHRAVAYARSGRRAEAWRSYVAHQRRHGAKGAYAAAVIAANLGDVDGALRWLELERQSGEKLRISALRRDPWFAPVWSDPRFDAFARAVEAR